MSLATLRCLDRFGAELMIQPIASLDPKPFRLMVRYSVAMAELEWMG
jgi:hypothetical protein